MHICVQQTFENHRRGSTEKFLLQPFPLPYTETPLYLNKYIFFLPVIDLESKEFKFDDKKKPKYIDNGAKLPWFGQNYSR